MVLGDRVQLQQVIINLVMNGIEAMQTVTDRRRELAIRSGQDEEQGVRISVTDCGVGISAESCKPAVQCLLHHEVERSRYGAFNLSVDCGGSRGTAVGIRRNDGPGATFQFVLPSHQGDAL